MTDQDMKRKIESTLKSFSSQTFSKSALALFAALGYNTTRQNPFVQKTKEEFEENFGHAFAEKNFNKEKVRFDEWKSVDLLFQLSREELSGQQGLFNTNKVHWEGEDNATVIETYLFFAIELTQPEYSRTLLAQITREVNKIFPMPVMIVFKHGQTLTISIIDRRLHKRDAQKDVLKKVTLIKDISISSPHRAHIEILFDLSLEELRRVHKFTNFVELHHAWQETLDTKELNKRFYSELSNWYFWAADYVSFPDDVEKNKNIRNATSLIRLITRIIFVWFIKEKSLVPDALFDGREMQRILRNFYKNKKSDSYYRAILQNLFFGTLNQQMSERGFAKEGTFLENKNNYGVKNLFRYAGDFAVSEKEVLALFKDIPFLNGGLFDCLDKENDQDKVVYGDGFSRNPKKQAVVPDFLFFGGEEDYDLNKIYGTKNKRYKVKGLFNIFSAYKFTVAENTPIEEEIALDPELLGRVFENLLASYNPETQTTARKQTGSFYTPREIVNYMVDESLKAYLKQHLETEAEMKPHDANAGLEILFTYTEKEHAFTGNETKILISAIDNCKILDPACGSGAFPMGVLHKFVYVLHKLDPQNAGWKERQISKARQIDDPAIREQSIANIESAFAGNELDYGRKLYLIENCIYGVDIQPIAVQIAKLRFFISLVVDQKKNAARKNLGILSLPNLETKFVAANTLIGLDKPQTGGQISIKDPEIEKLENELKALRHQYFTARTRREKLACQKKDRDLRRKISELLEKDGWNKNSAHQVAAFDPYDQNASSAFFDPEWMFGITDGFDVVIGNPPYGIINKKQNKAESIVVTEEELNYYKNSEYYIPATGGMINIFRLFILRSVRLLSANGIFSEIFPLAFAGDRSISNLRKYLLDNYQILFIEAFPERDDENKRVFEAVKMSVCILNLKCVKSDNPFFIRINDNRFINRENEVTYLCSNDIKIIDTENYSFPLTSLKETKLLKKIFLRCKRFSQYGKCNTGEIDMTFCKESFSTNDKHAVLLKGAIIDRYILRKKMSQGEIVFIDERKLSKVKTINSDLKNKERIVLQGITGVNEKTRLKMMIVKDAYCANSLNYLTINKDIHPYYFLGLLNSTLLNFIFSKFSTNSNVNGYEVDSLPICYDDNYEKLISTIVQSVLILKKKEKDSLFFELLMDAIVHELYFPEEIKAANAEVLKHLTGLPELKDDWSDKKKLEVIEKVYQELSNEKHPVAKAMSRQKTVPEVRIIEGLDK